jgi:hypothetical protein
MGTQYQPQSCVHVCQVCAICTEIVSMCVCICVCMHIHVCVYVWLSIYRCVGDLHRNSEFVCKYMCVYTYIHTHHTCAVYGEYAGWAHTILFAADLVKFRDRRDEVCMYACMYVCIYACMHELVYICTHIYNIHINT